MGFFKNIEKNKQKNRFFTKPKTIKLKFGNYGLINSREFKFELIQLAFLKKYIKFFLKRKNDLDVKFEKIWYFYNLNDVIQRKSKNSRMGKGKGIIEKKIIRLKKNFIFFEFEGIPILKIKFFIKVLNKKIKSKFFLIKKNFDFYPIWSKKNLYNYYFNKYLT